MFYSEKFDNNVVSLIDNKNVKYNKNNKYEKYKV